MDQVIITVYTRIAREQGASVDDILVTPSLRDEFMAGCQQASPGDIDEATTLRRLCNLRKQSKLPRTEELSSTTPSTVSVHP